MKVFIVDDAAIVSEWIAAMLPELEEIEIIGQAKNATGASNFIRKIKPDVVILDTGCLEEMDSMCSKISRNKNPAPVVIILINYPYPYYWKKCKELRANFFFDNSTEFNKINEVLKRLIQDSPNK